MASKLHHLEIELLGDGIAADAHDVDFGGRARRPARPTSQDRPSGNRRADRHVIPLVAASVGLLVVSILATRGTTLPAVSAGPAVSVTPSTFPPSDPTDTRGPGDFPSLTELGSMSGGAPLMDTAEPWSLYVDASGDVFRIDVLNGDVRLFDGRELSELEAYSVIDTVDGPKVLRLKENSYHVGSGPTGTYWSQPYDGGAELIDAATGQTVRTLVLPWGGDSSWLAGVTPSGDPIVSAPDRRLWVIAADDTLSPLSQGWPVNLSPGGSVWSRCDDAGICEVTAESAAGIHVLQGLAIRRYTFSPDGSWLAMVDSDESYNPVGWSLLDMTSGVLSSLDLPLEAVEQGSFSREGAFGSWSPDGRYLTVGGDNGISILDTQTMAVSDFPIEAIVGRVQPIAVL